MDKDLEKQIKADMDERLEHLKSEFRKIRTSKASLSILDGVLVEYYGNKVPIKQVASLTSPDAKTIIIQPWDKGVTTAIETAIAKANLGVGISADGNVIRLNFPPLTEERRKEIVKLARSRAEETRISIRSIRREYNDIVKKKQKDGELSEDDAKHFLNDIQKITDQYIKEIDKLLADKEKEIMTV